MAWVLECQWQAADRLKAQALPEANGSLVSANDEVELHSLEAAVAGVSQRVFAHPARYGPPCSTLAVI
jgi:hypothetical protein